MLGSARTLLHAQVTVTVGETMRSQFHTVILLPCLSIGLVACTAKVTSNPRAAQPCAAGTQLSCDCEAGWSGVQTCRGDGTGYDACHSCKPPVVTTPDSPADNPDRSPTPAPTPTDDGGTPADDGGIPADDGGAAPSTTPVKIATLDQDVQRLMLDGTTMYGTTLPTAGTTIKPAKVFAIATTTGEVATIADAQQDLGSLVQDAANLYWASAAVVSGPRTIWKQPKAGGTPSAIALNSIGATSLQVVNGTIYWVDNGVGQSTGQYILSSPTANPKEAILFQNVPTPYLHVDSNEVAYAVGTSSHDIWYLGLTNSTSSLLVSTNPIVAVGVDADASHVYWAAQSGGVYRAAKTGGSSTLIVDQVASFALDAAGIYFVGTTTKDLQVAPLSGGTPRTLVKGPFSGTRLAVDAAYVYYTVYDPTTQTAALWRAPK
jgi:hypothetical protein